MKFLSLFTIALAKVDHHETEEFWVYPGGEVHTHTGTKVWFKNNLKNINYFQQGRLQMQLHVYGQWRDE